MAKFDFNKPVASFSWYLQNGSADDKRGNRLHVGTGQKAQIYFDPESGEFIGKLKYVDDYIDLADGAKQHFELPRTAREYKPSDFSPKFPISNVKFEVDESVKDFIHVLPRGLFFYQNEFYDAVFGDKTDYPESLKDFLFTRTGDIEAAGEFYGAIEKWPQSVYGTLVEKCNVENRPIPEYENDRVLPLDYHKELLASLKDHFGCGESNYRTPGDLIAARSYGSYLSGISLKFNPQDVIAAVEHATETVQAELVPYLMTASEVCKKTLGILEPEPPQPAKTKNLSQKTMSSREASTRLSDEIGVKPCTRDEGTVATADQRTEV